MNRLGMLMAGLLLAAAGCASESGTSSPVKPLPAFLPADRAVNTWDLAGKVSTYNGDNLYLYLGEPASRFRDYGLEQLTQVQYRIGLEGKERLNVEVYRMSSDFGAFGIYSVERDPKAEPAQVGAVATQSQLKLDFTKGREFVRLKLDQAVPNSKDALLEMARYIASNLPGSDMLPAQFAAFPTADRVPNSERFVARKFWGRDYLDEAFEVGYRIDGKPVQMWLLNARSPNGALGTLTRLRSSLSGEAEVELPGIWSTAFWGYDKDLGRIFVFQRGSFLGGARGVSDQATARRLAQELASSLP